MIKIGDKVLRNLEEQVLKNKEDIANHYNMDRVLADFGIRIVGTLPSAADLPIPYNGEFGDAFAVGDAAPYDFFIWTRADPNSGHPDDYWFYIGALAIEGPQGKQGEPGPKGEDGARGSIWISAPRNPDTIDGFKPGDQWLNTLNGYVYNIIESNGVTSWNYSGTIRGPQGIQGKQGERGETGDTGDIGPQGPRGEGALLVTLNGVITSVDQLPSPETLLRTAAYLQDVNGEYHLWVIVGETGDLSWVDTGPFSVGTLITNNGNVIREWDIKMVLDGPFDPDPFSSGPFNEFGTSKERGLVYQSDTSGTYYIRPATVEQTNPYYFAPYGSIMQRDIYGTTGVIAKALIPDMKLRDVPKGLGSTTSLPEDYATPRAYVDAQIGYAANERIPYPASIPLAGMLLSVNPDKSVEAIDASTLVGESIGVECWIVQRGETRVLPRDRVYLIRGYGDNSVRLIDRVTGNTIIDKCTMAIGMVSSSFWPHSPADNKAWAGFLYQTGSYSLSWNGDIRGEVEVVNINSGTSGTGFLYIYTLGAKSND